MTTISGIRSRQTAAQIRALAEVEPEVKACDQSWRRKYLQDYAEAFRSYKKVLSPCEVEARIAVADVILLGDYHALPACQQFAAKLVKDLAQIQDRPVVLAVETIFSRDQHILDEWWRREIDAAELRERTRFDLDWGYDWDPFYGLLSAARERADALYGLDCMPREDLRKINTRDRHAADKIVEIRERHPRAVIIALMGESHLAPAHLPALVRKQLKTDNILTILQNVDALYSNAISEPEQVEAVLVNASTICVFNSTPIEKYESYRLCLHRWSTEQRDIIDFAPAIYGLIDDLLRYLDINRYSSTNGAQPKFLVDSLPEVCGPSTDHIRTRLSRQGLTEKETKAVFRLLKDRGCCYLPQENAFLVSEFQVTDAAEEAARFVHHACQGLPLRRREPARLPRRSPGSVHAEMLEHALACLGSQLLTRREVPLRTTDLSRRESARSSACQKGRSLGAGLYDAYLEGALSRTDLRRLFLFPLNDHHKARDLYLRLARRVDLTR